MDSIQSTFGQKAQKFKWDLTVDGTYHTCAGTPKEFKAALNILTK